MAPLQGLVGEVDEQLLEGVDLELLEAVDVQHADEAPLLLRLGRRDGLVEALHQPGEQEGEDSLGQGVALVLGLPQRLRLDDAVAAHHQHLGRDGLAQVLGGHAQQLGHGAQRPEPALADLAAIVGDFLELDVADVQHDGDHGEDVLLRVLAQPYAAQAVLGHLELLGIIPALDALHAPRQVPERLLVQLQARLGGLVRARAQLVEHVVAALSWALVDDAGLLQQIVGDLGAGDGARGGELDPDVLAESTAVWVVLDCGVGGA